MTTRKIIFVTGATGAQGGSVAKALLASGEYAVRALTRNAQSEKAIALKEQGADVVEGDFENEAELTELIKGCYGVFGVTNFWEHFGNEFRQGKNLVNAVHAAGIKHFVLSTLPNYHALSNGKLSVAHCDIKAALEEYTKSLGLPATFLHVAYYYENFLSFFPLQKDDADGYWFGFPQGDTKLSMYSVEDTGPLVLQLFNHPEQYIGRLAGAVGEDRSCAAYAAVMTKVLGYPVHYRYIPYETYAAMGWQGAEEIAAMFEVQRLHIPERWLHLIESYGLHPAMQSFEQWLTKHKSSFPAHTKVPSAALEL